MKEINLIPQDFKPRAPVIRFAKSLQKIAFTALAIFLVFMVIEAGSIVFLTDKVKEVRNVQEKLKKEIKALEQTEQRLVLIKDRLEKSGEILGDDNASEEVDILKELVESLNQETQISKAELTSDKTKVTILTNKSANFSDLLSKTVSSGKYGKIHLDSLGFTEGTGYEIVLSFAR